MQRKARKHFNIPVATFDPLSAAPFMVTNINPANVTANKNLFYYRVDSQVVIELIKNILTDAEYSKLMLKTNMFTFQDDTTRNEIIDGLCLLKLLFYCINPNFAVGVKVLRQKLKATKITP